jgi:hypothetical protein
MRERKGAGRARELGQNAKGENELFSFSFSNFSKHFPKRF